MMVWTTYFSFKIGNFWVTKGPKLGLLGVGVTKGLFADFSDGDFFFFF